MIFKVQALALFVADVVRSFVSPSFVFLSAQLYRTQRKEKCRRREEKYPSSCYSRVICLHVSHFSPFFSNSFILLCVRVSIVVVVVVVVYPPHLLEVSLPLYWCRHSFPHRCIFPSRRRFCITDGARQCPLLVLIYYSLLSRSSNNEAKCKSRMVDIISYQKHLFSLSQGTFE